MAINKKLHTLLFLAVATLFNVVVIFIVFVVGFVLLGQLVLPVVSATIGQILLIVLFCASLVVGYVVYSRMLKWVVNRYDTSKFMEPLFKNQNSKR